MKSTTTKIVNKMGTTPNHVSVLEAPAAPSTSPMVSTPFDSLANELHIVLLVGTSSVGKSTLCRELKKVADEKHFHVVKNGDEILEHDHLPKVVQKFRDAALLDKLTPMRIDEIVRFCMYDRLNILEGEHLIKDRKIEDLTSLEGLIESAGYDKETSSRIANNLKLAKEIFKSMPGETYEESLQNSFKEALSPENVNKTVVVDLVPEATPLLTEELLESFEKKADDFSKINRINVKVDRVLIFCTLEKLKENMNNRNRRAEEQKNLTDIRLGISPFQMLTSIATCARATLVNEAKDPKATKKLFSTSKSHIRECVRQYSPAEEMEKNLSELIGEGDRWLHGFRIPRELGEKELVTFCVPKELHFHYTVDTTLRAPSELADELAGKLNIKRPEVGLGPKPRL